MKLGLDSFRAIKPVGSIDDYMAGHAIINEKGLTRKQVGVLFTNRIIDILNFDSGMCNKQVALFSGVSRASTAKKLRQLKEKGLIRSFSKKVGDNAKPTNFYYLVAAI